MAAVAEYLFGKMVSQNGAVGQQQFTTRNNNRATVQKTGQRKGECEDGKHSGNDHDGADGIVRHSKNTLKGENR